MVDGEASINNVNKIFPRYTSLVPKGHSHMTSVELWKFGTPPSALSHFKQPTFINTINQQNMRISPPPPLSVDVICECPLPLSPSNKYKDMEAPLRSAGVSLVSQLITDRKGQEIRCKTIKIAKAPGVGMCVDWVVERDCPILQRFRERHGQCCLRVAAGP